MAEKFGNWQEILDDFLSTASNSNCLQVFTGLTSDKDRIEHILNKNLLRDVEWLQIYFDNCQSWHQKDSLKATELKCSGNDCFKKKKYEDAVKLYTESIIQSTVNNNGISSDLALAYGNRSAALFYLKYYEECLIDIQNAIDSNFPADSIYKLYIRRLHCHCHLKQFDRATSELENTCKMINRMKCVLEINKYESINKEIKDIRKNIAEGLKDKEDVKCDKPKVDDIPVVCYGKNAIITQATDAVDMKYNKEQGRFLTCNRDIDVGNTLIVEKPFSAVLLPDHYTTHCHHCYKKLPPTVIGCSQCTLVRYCSKTCQLGSWTSYHSIECNYLDILHSVGIAHLSLRTVILAGLQYLQDFQKEQNKETSKESVRGINHKGCYDRDYLTVYDLMTHTDDMETEDLYQYSLTASLLLVVLIHSGWFDVISGNSNKLVNSDIPNKLQTGKDIVSNIIAGDSNDTGLTKNMVDIGGLLLRHIQQLVCNAHAITEVSCSDEHNDTPVVSTDQVRVATAIYPTASLMNHSCQPSISSSFHGDVLVVKAVKSLQQGEEVSNCYGPDHRRMTRSRRQEILANQYFFNCSCIYCMEERDSDLQFNAAICIHCKGYIDTICKDPVCRQCDEKEDPFSKRSRAEINSLLQLGAEFLVHHSDIPGALCKIRPCLELCKQYLHPNNKLRAAVEDCLARCYATSGDFKKALSHLEYSIQVTELMYGLQSIEVAHELQKLADILFNAKFPTQALQVINRATAIFKTHYGDSHETVKDLNEMRDCLIDYLGAEDIKKIVL